MFLILGSIISFSAGLLICDILQMIFPADPLIFGCVFVLLFILFFFLIPLMRYEKKNNLFWDISFLRVGMGLQMSSFYKKRHPGFKGLLDEEKRKITKEEIKELWEEMRPGNYYFFDTHGIVMKNMKRLQDQGCIKILFMLPSCRRFIISSYKDLYDEIPNLSKKKCYFILVKCIKPEE